MVKMYKKSLGQFSNVVILKAYTDLDPVLVLDEYVSENFPLYQDEFINVNMDDPTTRVLFLNIDSLDFIELER